MQTAIILALAVIVLGIVITLFLPDRWVLIITVAYGIFLLYIDQTMDPIQGPKGNSLILASIICGFLFWAAMLATWVVKTPKVKKTESSPHDDDEN